MCRSVGHVSCSVSREARSVIEAKGDFGGRAEIGGADARVGAEDPRYGYRFITAKLRQEGWQVNFKRIYRLWRQEGLKVPRKTRKKRRLGHSGNSCVRRRAEHKDHVWTWDFIHDRTTERASR